MNPTNLPDQEEGLKITAEKPIDNERNGAIFGFLSIPVILFSLLAGLWHLVNYIARYGWARNSTKLWMELEEPFEYSTPSHSFITVHALLGLSALFLSLFQASTGTLLSLQTNKKENFMCAEVTSSVAGSAELFCLQSIPQAWFWYTNLAG